MKYKFKLTPIGKAAFDIMHYINDAKSAGFFCTLEYIASNPDAAKCLNELFTVPMSDGRDADDILKMAGLPSQSLARLFPKSDVQKDLDNLVLFGTLKKCETIYLPLYSITLAGHDVCVTYKNLYDVARSQGLDDNKARAAVSEWLHITTKSK
jgi:hypothetical protein